MTFMATPTGIERLYTVADLETVPDDGRRYELVDGALLVSPAPTWQQQEVAGTLFVVLRAACPRPLRVIGAPFAVQIDDYNELQPDILVAGYGDLTAKNLPRAPVLAVEVLSPSTRVVDATLKHAVYVRTATPSYWLVDPDPEHPSLTVFELAGGAYQQVAQVTGDEVFEAERPFPVRIVPAELVAGLHP